MPKRNAQEGAIAPNETRHWEIGLRAHVRNMERAMLANPAMVWLINIDLDAANRDGTKMSPRRHNISVAESQQHVIDPTNPSSTLDDGVEHRLHVRGRAADDPEHFGRCRLMLQRLARFCVTFLQFLDQRYVFNGHHALIREGF